MSQETESAEELRRENDNLRQRLEEVESIVRAIRSNEVDAFVVQQEGEDHVLVLDGVDRPYRLLIERMHQGAAVLCRDGSIIYVNRRLAELLDRPGPSLIGGQFADHVAEAGRPALGEMLREGAGGDSEREVSLRRNDGVHVPALLTVSPLLESDGVLCLIVTDLTLQKRHEAEREQFVQEHAARAAAEQIAAALRTADRRKDEFLATLGHELRNPLAPLRNGLQILGYHIQEGSTLEATLGMMERQLESLIRLVNDLLDVGRVTQGKINLQVKPTDLRLAVGRAVESCRLVLDERNHLLELNVPPVPVPVEIDLVRITQVVTNLLNNAAKFTPRGGTIWLTVNTDPATGQAVLRVRDTGKGIAPEMLTSVFELFTQVEPGVARSEGGLGIGLTLARCLVEMHGGTIEATSPGLGQGSEFIVRLPLIAASRENAAAGPADTTAAEQATVRRRVLIVDDNRDSVESLASLLQMQGHEVCQAHDGPEALAILEQFVPDLLLLDIGMPGMDGYEVVRQVRSKPALRGVQVVAVTGYGGEEERRRSQEAGFAAHIVKPLDLAALRSLLDSL